MKKVLSIIVCMVMMVVSVPYTTNAVSLKPSKVKITSAKQISKSAIKVKWKKVSKAKGYEVYMKTNSGSFKKIKTTKSAELKKSGLKVNKKYYFKVRAYRNYKGKKYYGKYSKVKTVNMKSYVYLISKIQPYAFESNCFWNEGVYNDWGYYVYDNARPLKMGGNNYYNSFIMIGDNVIKKKPYACFNLNGAYSKLEFEAGALNNVDENLLIECDDEFIDNIEVKAHSIPRKYVYNVRGVYKLKLSLGFHGKMGFGNVKLYY